MIEISNLTVQYPNGVKALNEVSISLMGGEICSLLGANGAGKSTLLLACLNFLQPISGTIMIDGVNVIEDPVSARNKIGYLPDDCQLFGEMTVAENIRFFASLLSTASKVDVVDRLLEEVRLENNVKHRKVAELSKGMRQRIGLGIVMMRNAKVLLLDEPTSGLDVSSSRQLSDVVLSLRSRGACILICTHDLFRTQEISDRVLILSNGQVVAQYDKETFQTADIESLFVKYVALPSTI